jgi:hypothetical protein
MAESIVARLSESEAAEAVSKVISQQGYLVELSISRWSGRARLVEADLGLEGLTDADLHHLGRRQLVPAKELAEIGKIESRARARVTDVSYRFPVGGGRFVPNRVLGNLLADLAKIRADYTKAVDAFCASYEKIAEDMRAQWAANAQQIKTSLGKDDAWVEAFNARLAASYPAIDEVRGAFSMEWSLFEFALPSNLKKQLVDASTALEAGRLAEEARRAMESKVNAFVGEAALELRRRAGAMCAHVAQQVKDSGGKVTERTLQPLRDLIEQFKAMDFTGDAVFAAELDKMQSQWLGADKEAGTAAKLREDTDYREQLAAALTTVSDRALAESEKAASEALERFLKFGGAGRAVAV